MSHSRIHKDLQYYKFCAYGFFKNLRFFEPFLILFFLEKEINYTGIGLLYATREITRNLFEIPAGIIADVLGRRRTMIFSFLMYILSFIIFYLSSHFAILMTAMIVYSFGDAFRTGTHKAMIFEYLKIKGWTDQKVHYYGHTRSWSQFGSALSSLLAAFIVFTNRNYQSVFLYSLIPYILDLTLISTYPRMLDGNIGKLKWTAVVANFRKVFRDFIYSFKKRKVLKAISNTAVYSGYYRAIKDYLQPVLKSMALALPLLAYLNDQQRSALLIGVFYFIIYLLTSLTSRLSGWFSQRFSRYSKALNITLLVGLVPGLLIGLFYEIKLTVLAIGFYLIIFLIENLRKPIGVAYVADQMEKDILATALSVESQLKSLISGGIAICLGFLSDRFGVGIAIGISTAILFSISPFYLVKTSE